MKKIILALLIMIVIGLAAIDASLLIRRRLISRTSQNLPVEVKQPATDKCQTPPGYTPEEWQDHISHHPDQYRECLTAK